MRKRTFFARAILMYAIKKFDGQFKPRQARDQQTNKQTNKQTNEQNIGNVEKSAAFFCRQVSKVVTIFAGFFVFASALKHFAIYYTFYYLLFIACVCPRCL